MNPRSRIRLRLINRCFRSHRRRTPRPPNKLVDMQRIDRRLMTDGGAYCSRESSACRHGALFVHKLPPLHCNRTSVIQPHLQTTYPNGPQHTVSGEIYSIVCRSLRAPHACIILDDLMNRMPADARLAASVFGKRPQQQLQARRHSFSGRHRLRLPASSSRQWESARSL